MPVVALSANKSLDSGSSATVTPLVDMALYHHSDAGARVVNVGDMLQIWFTDRYRAAVQRVRPVTGRFRYCLPFFFNPAYETDVTSLVTGEEQPPYRTVSWGAFRQARTDGDYADYGHEIQIADFRHEER